MTKVLVTAASKHGATREIAQFIAKTLTEQGHEASFKDMEKFPELSSYDAAVLGSAVYMGKWRKTARTYVEKNHEVLKSLPIWIFSSGPIGKQEDADQGKTVIIDNIMRQTKARNHKVFSGKLDKNSLSIFEHAVVSATRAKEGDFRNWAEITAWTIGIANTLHNKEYV